MTYHDLIMYSIGIVILLIGVAVLVRERAVAAAPNEDLNRDDSSDSLLEEGNQDFENDNSDGVSIPPQELLQEENPPTQQSTIPAIT